MNANKNYWNAQITVERLETALITARERVKQCRNNMLQAAARRLKKDRLEMERDMAAEEPIPMKGLYSRVFKHFVRPDKDES